MAPRLVNNVPGVATDPLHPGQDLYFGLRSEAGSVQMASLRSVIGFSGISHRGIRPENDAYLNYLNVQIDQYASERRRPVTGAAAKSVSGGNLLITRVTSDLGERAVYEVSNPITDSSSVMAYFRVRKKNAWSRMNNPDWCNLTNMTGAYFGLEHGVFNNALYAFLRGAPGGPGYLVIGGPLPGFLMSRPAQESIALDWTSLAEDDPIEIWIYFNQDGYPSPFTPAHTPIVEVWARLGGVGGAVLLKRLGAQFAQFPPISSNLYNSRVGPSDQATIIFGNLGSSGDVLEYEDWALYPDCRVAVSEGEASANHALNVSPDAPITYRSKDNLLPEEAVPGRWFHIGALPTNASLSKQPGRVSSPQYVTIPKTTGLLTGYEREEPRLEQLQEGAMVEAFLSADDVAAAVTDGVFGAGLSIEDGSKIYRAILLYSNSSKTIGLKKLASDISDLVPGYLVPNVAGVAKVVDWSSLKVFRLTVDRKRARIIISVDETVLSDLPLSTPMPVAAATGKVKFGHLDAGALSGSLNVQFLNYLSRYQAWEMGDVKTPDDGTLAIPFTKTLSGTGTSTILANNPLVINKQSFGTVGSKLIFSKTQDLGDTKGILVDFKAKVVDYTDDVGRHFQPETDVGAGVTLFLGNKKMRLGFFDGGTRGKYIGIVPGSGSVADLITQTPLGRQFSSAINWTNNYLYRVIYRAHKSIEVWVNTVTGSPLISIPWRSDTQGFDLPTDLTSPSVSFGHSEEGPSSKTEWEYFRWGQSNGYDVTVRQDYAIGYQPYLFGGQALVLSDFDG